MAVSFTGARPVFMIPNYVEIDSVFQVFGGTGSGETALEVMWKELR